MTTSGPPSDLGPLDRLASMAESVAAAVWRPAAASTSPGQERTILRLLGVSGLDRAGRPLAAECVERHLAGHPDRLAAGVALPFAAALVEYDTDPQQLALDVASGAVDLALESETLADPELRAAAEAALAGLVASALDRIDANRTARHELVDLLGDARTPWIGTGLSATDATSARREAAGLVADGIDIVSVAVPPIRELAEKLHDEGVDVPFWRPRAAAGAARAHDLEESAPAGSQRGLAELRQAIDAAAAERRSYARLATFAMPLAVPEQALVAAFEQIDVVFADAVTEMVEGNVDPGRSLADHAFAHRLLARSGASVLVGPGPLAVAPDLARGIPFDASVRAGRALALQLVGIGLARLAGLPTERLIAGAIPPWILDEDQPGALAMAQVAVRRVLLAGHPLAFEEPEVGTATSLAWPAILGAALPLAGPVGVVFRRTLAPTTGDGVRSTRAAVSVGREVSRSIGPLDLRGPAAEMARQTVAAAVATLERLAAEGWSAVLGGAPESLERPRIGAASVAERSEAFDPLTALDRSTAGLPGRAR